MDDVYEWQFDILNDTRVFITDVSNDAYYINLYVATYDQMRNRGCLTIISQKYINEFAYFLGGSQNESIYRGNLDAFILPHK